MAKHVLRTWTGEDGLCTCVEVFDDETLEIVHYEVPNNGRKEVV